MKPGDEVTITGTVRGVNTASKAWTAVLIELPHGQVVAVNIKDVTLIDTAATNVPFA